MTVTGDKGAHVGARGCSGRCYRRHVMTNSQPCRALALPLLIVVSGLVSIAGASHADDQSDKITVGHNYAEAEWIRSELEFLRKEMGRPLTSPLAISVSDAEPYQVYFQALTLFRRMDALSFDLIREKEGEPDSPEGKIIPSDVYSLLRSARTRIDRIRKGLGLPTSTTTAVTLVNKDPTDVFLAIVKTNRQINLLLDSKFSASDVYRQITVAMDYTSRLRAQFPGKRMPKEPKFIPRKRPPDVYRKLLNCFTLIQDIKRLSEISTMKLAVNSADIDNATPSDVYDIASLLVGELHHLYRMLPQRPPLRSGYYPGVRFPSHAYQRASHLEVQLLELKTLIQADRGWLKSNAR